MKYLRYFNESRIENFFREMIGDDEIVQDLKDICIELDDVKFYEGGLGYGVGFDTNYFNQLGNKITEIPGRKQTKKDAGVLLPFIGVSRDTIEDPDIEEILFNYNKIKDVVERIQDYMIDKGYQVHIIKEKIDADSLEGYEKRRLGLLWLRDPDEIVGIKIIFIKNKSITEKVKIDDSILQDIKDICLELEDVGLYTYILSYQNTSEMWLMIYSPSDNNFIGGRPYYGITGLREFYWKDIKDTILRLIDFLKMRDIKLHEIVGRDVKTSFDNHIRFGKHDLNIPQLIEGSCDSFLELNISFEKEKYISK